jgi:hypothetical protein
MLALHRYPPYCIVWPCCFYEYRLYGESHRREHNNKGNAKNQNASNRTQPPQQNETKKNNATETNPPNSTESEVHSPLTVSQWRKATKLHKWHRVFGEWARFRRFARNLFQNCKCFSNFSVLYECCWWKLLVRCKTLIADNSVIMRSITQVHH